MKTAVIVMTGLLLLGTGAAAQQAGTSPGQHARQNAGSVYYQGPRQQPVQQPQQQAPRPTGYWEKTWGAIAPSLKGGALGTALRASSKEEAERLALEDCKAKKGGGCWVDIAYNNQCAVMVLGSKYLNTARAATIEEASNFGLEYCREKDSGCRVYYSACTEPIFHRY